MDWGSLLATQSHCGNWRLLSWDRKGNYTVQELRDVGGHACLANSGDAGLTCTASFYGGRKPTIHNAEVDLLVISH